MNSGDDELARAVERGMQCQPARQAVMDIYARLQVEIDQRKPICVASGKCCHFESYGHRLYVTTLELAAFFADLEGVPKPVSEGMSRRPGSDAIRSGSSGNTLRHRLGVELTVLDASRVDGCVFQDGKLCGVHAIRPFGCRVFFCDPTATQWQQDQYERFHSELKQLHERFGIPYFYVEWRMAVGVVENQKFETRNPGRKIRNPKPEIRRKPE